MKPARVDILKAKAATIQDKIKQLSDAEEWEVEAQRELVAQRSVRIARAELRRAMAATSERC